MNRPFRTNRDSEPPVDLDLAYWAWAIIANVSGGDWTEQDPEWAKAAGRWRDAFHTKLAEREPPRRARRGSRRSGPDMDAFEGRVLR